MPTDDQGTLPLRAWFDDVQARHGSDIAVAFGSYFEAYWALCGRIRSRRQEVRRIQLRMDLLKVTPSAVVPAILVAFQLLGVDVQPAMQILATALGPAGSGMVIMFDRTRVQPLRGDEKNADQMHAILVGVLQLYNGTHLPSHNDKTQYWSKWADMFHQETA